MKRTLTAILTAALALSSSADVQLVPAGEFQGRTGRPGDGLTWKLDDNQGEQLAQLLNARHADGRAQFNFDYDHQTMLAAQNGQKAPASGWASKFEWRPGQGLYALNVRWTQTAKAEISDEQYKYVSPVILFDKTTGVITDVLHASLTNFPDLMQMGAVTEAVAALNAQFSTATTQESDVTLLAQLLAKLGLPADTTETAALTAVAAIKSKADAAPKPDAVPTALSAALGLAGDATQTAALSAIATLKTAGTSSADQTTIQTIQALQAQIATLSAAENTRTVTGLIDKAITDGKLLPAQKDWATNLGTKDVAALSAFIESAPVVAKSLGQGQSGDQQQQGAGKDGLTTEEVAMCSALGLTPEQFKAAKPATA